MKLTHWMGAMLVALAFTSGVARAQSDEIQVYDGGLAPPGVFNLTLHDNFTPDGLKQPAFPGGIATNGSLFGVPEWAYGVTDWFEAGLYLPLYSIDRQRGGSLDGFKLRTLFAVPHADRRTFVYGVNFEFSYNAKRWDPERFTSEIRPILAWHLGLVDLVLNPILDTSWDGFGNLDFAPSSRLALNVSPAWAVGLEEYADLGPLHHFDPVGRQSHQLYGVLDHDGHALEVEAGVGVGLTSQSDPLTLKLILSRDLN